MGQPYTEGLVSTFSEDGVLLEGVVIRPAGGPARPLVVVWIHGFTGRFYEPFVLAIGRQTAARGFTFVSGNNRGHHIGAELRRKDGQRLLGGGWWERLEETPLDIAAWIAFACALGDSRVVLAGHSLGAVKVPFYQAQRQDRRVAAMILASPPVRIAAGLGKNDPALAATAERMVAAGQGEELVAPTGGQTLSAQTYVSWGSTNWDVFGVQIAEPMIAQIRCPLLVCLGTNEEWVVTRADVELIRRHATAQRFDVRVLEGADHEYTGHEEEAGVQIAEWLETL